MNADDTETPTEPITTVIVTQDCPHCVDAARRQADAHATLAEYSMFPRFDPLRILELFFAVVGAIAVGKGLARLIHGERTA